MGEIENRNLLEFCMDGEDFLEHVECQIAGQYFFEDQDIRVDASDDDIKKLGEMLYDVFEKWINDRNIQKTFQVFEDQP